MAAPRTHGDMQDWATELQQHLQAGRTNAAAWMFRRLMQTPEAAAAWQEVEQLSAVDPVLHGLVHVVRTDQVDREAAMCQALVTLAKMVAGYRATITQLPGRPQP